MKSGFLIAVALVASLSSAFGQTAPRTITMSGQGEVRAAPDTVTLSAGATSEAATAAAALAANSALMQAVFAALKKLGVADKDMQTSNFSVSPQMTGGGAGNQAPRITGYQARNQVRVRLDDVGKLGAALDTLVTAGANQMNGIDFGFKDDASLMAQARAGAVAQARAKAETYAKAAGVSLGPILSISEYANQGPRPQFLAARAMAGNAVPVAAGEESVTAEITIIWEIH